MVRDAVDNIFTLDTILTHVTWLDNTPLVETLQKVVKLCIRHECHTLRTFVFARN